jgi:hypothetical protein
VAVKSLLAMALFNQGDLRGEAVELDVASLQPRTPEDYLFRGALLLQVEEPRKGLEDINRAVGIRDSPVARLARANARGMLAFDTGKTEDGLLAIRGAEEVQESLPNCGQALNATLTARLMLWQLYEDGQGPGYAGRAAEQRDAAGALMPKASRSRDGMLALPCHRYWVRSKRRDRARRYVEEFWNATRDPWVGDLLAIDYMSSGEAGRARDVFRALRRKQALQTYSLFTDGWARAEMGDAKDAYAGMKALPPSGGPHSLHRGSLALLLGDVPAAREACKSALEGRLLPPWRGGWYEAQARFVAGDGGPEEEKAFLRRAGASRLNLCEAHFHIGMRRLAVGGRAEARRHFEQVIATRVFFYIEHMWAEAFLARMDASRAWPSWIPAK